MKLFFINFFFIFLLLANSVLSANDLVAEYSVTSSGIKIGKFSWSLKLSNDKYETKISLINSGIFSPLYKFQGEYLSKGVIENNKFKSQKYKQNWKTRNKIRVVEMLFDDRLIELYQNPEEKEVARINVYDLKYYFDPITSFINILSGAESVNTVDGRRVYTMKKTNTGENKRIVLEIKNYKNIWADHKRNDLEKIEFILDKEKFLPQKIKIYFKKRVFNLNKR